MIFVILLEADGFASHDQIQCLAFNDGSRRFLHLLLGEMDQKIRNEKYRIILIIAHAQDHCLAVFLHNDAVNRKRDRHILVFLDASVIVGVQICDIAVLIERILLDIESGGVNVRTDNVDAVFEGRLADFKQNHGFVHPYAVYSVTGLQFAAFSTYLIEFPVTVGLRLIDKAVHTLTFCLTAAQKFLIIFCEIHT